MPAAGDVSKCIRVRGAREHNLQNIDVDIPRDELVVVTGLSGSGKSSLAFDTLYAEGQRKYMESLSAYARQFLDQLQKPDMDSIEGLPPTIAIEQRSSGHNPRSTVATTTEIYDYLRLLFARCGTPRCWAPVGKGRQKRACGCIIERQGATQIIDLITGMKPDSRLMLLAPVVRGKKGYHREVFEDLQALGYVRARVDGNIRDLREILKQSGDNPAKLGRYERHTIEAIVDRIILKPDSRSRLADSVETTLKLGGGLITVASQPRADADWTDQTYSEHFACPEHPEISLEELEPRLFSFNSPFGACAGCGGLGTVQEFDLDLIVEDESLTVSQGAISAFKRIGHAYRAYFTKVIKRVCRRFKIDTHTPWKSLPAEAKRILLYGSTPKDREEYGSKFAGVIPILHQRFENTDTERVKERISALMSQTPCPECEGKRLRTEALNVFVETARPITPGSNGTGHEASRFHIADVTAMTVEQACQLSDSLKLTKEHAQIAQPIQREISARLGFLQSVGLGYLNLSRRTGTLSGGEAQRIRLATQVGTGLVGVCYVLDEPTIGLHQRDNGRLIATLRQLADIGNTVIVVEHDEEMIRSADHVVDLGPGPGVHGGRVVAQGTIPDIIGNPESITGRFLSHADGIAVPPKRRTMNTDRAVTVKGARANNLKNIDVAFPLEGLICVTGVSGSGKSTLVNETLLRAVRRHLHGSREKPGAHSRVTGLSRIDRIVDVDQSPIGRTPRSNPATYTGMFDDIRSVFTKTKEAKIRGYLPGRFSFNVKGGRCEACQGQGTKKIEMHFLPDVYVQCEACHGSRYNRETLEVSYRHKNIADVLSMTVEEGCEFFAAHPKTLKMLECLHDVGLDYIELGQPSPTLSGGEAQRVKLATELGKGSASPTAARQHTLYILDEPTTGLHFADIKKLLSVLNRLADQGNTLIVIEHNLDVIKGADWIIDLGPEGGEAGGTVVASGTPEQVARVSKSHTGQYLRDMLG
ncbi:MAG: excinuclease ABC subunit UvrA [Planctomycetes bacterium]|nr:excinuclease ABC subunit UvrA [Planctomycetota bacterium]NOG54771.1 excinuclease ABC subunit UvrA [Planctomycetota bacterium]